MKSKYFATSNNIYSIIENVLLVSSKSLNWTLLNIFPRFCSGRHAGSWSQTLHKGNHNQQSMMVALTSMQRITKNMKKTVKIEIGILMSVDLMKTKPCDANIAVGRVKKSWQFFELMITTPCDAYMAVSRVRRGLCVRDGEVATLHLMIFFFCNGWWGCLNNVASYCWLW